jgi:predicted nucleic acid-binding protein
VIVVDTSVWIDHLHRREDELVVLLERNEVGVHPMVIGELALGSIKDRGTVLGLLGDLPGVMRCTDAEVLALVEAQQLWSQGLSVVDAHLLASVMITPEARLWTRDRRLDAAAAQRSVSWTTPG